jgi:hypothetical protein
MSPIKVLEVSNSPWIKGASIPWPICIAKVYIKKETLSLEAATHSHEKYPLSAAAKEGEDLLQISTISEEEEGGRGVRSLGKPPPPRVTALHEGVPPSVPCPLLAWSPLPLGEAPFHHHLQQHPSSPYCNLLANMMLDAIYYYPMIYCISMPMFEL